MINGGVCCTQRPMNCANKNASLLQIDQIIRLKKTPFWFDLDSLLNFREKMYLKSKVSTFNFNFKLKNKSEFSNGNLTFQTYETSNNPKLQFNFFSKR